MKPLAQTQLQAQPQTQPTHRALDPTPNSASDEIVFLVGVVTRVTWGEGGGGLPTRGSGDAPSPRAIAISRSEEGPFQNTHRFSNRGHGRRNRHHRQRRNGHRR